MTELQKKIIAEMKVTSTINVQAEIRRSIDFMKAYLRKHPFLKGYVLGISGGQDSTLCAKLAQMTIDELNAEAGDDLHSFVAIRLPYDVQLDESDCQDALAFVNPTEVLTVNIKDSVDASFKNINKAMGTILSDFNKGNMKARHRMEVQYSVAATRGLAVLGTDHSSEAVTGFFTKFGDGGADLCPLFRLNKRQGRMLLEMLGCPEHLYLKTPTADLEEDAPLLADEDALGVSYTAIDDYLEGHSVPEGDARRIEELYLKSRHKRHLPITVFDDWWKV